jgi:hypothetical protein
MSSPAPLLDVHQTTHRLGGEPLLELEALADAASELPARCIEHHLADLPLLLPGGVARQLPNKPADVVRDLATNGCWVMLARLERLSSYRPLLERAFGELALPLPPAEGAVSEVGGTAFLAAPHARVPVHFDKVHGILLQIRGSKTVWTGTYADPWVAQHEVERRLGPAALNAGAVPDHVTAHRLTPGDALFLPAFTFHWVEGEGDISISLSVGFATRRTTQWSDCHRANVRLRTIRFAPRPPGLAPRRDALKAGAVGVADHTLGRLREIDDYFTRLAHVPTARYKGLGLLSGALSGHAIKASRGDWDAAASLADEHLLGPALWVALRHDPSVLPEELCDQLRRSHLSNLGRNLLLRRQLDDALARLAVAGIPALVLKGARCLLQNPFVDLGERVMADLDVMVPSARLADAAGVLTAAGYTPRPRPAYEHPHELPMGATAWPALVELHAHIGQPALQRVLPSEDVWAAAVPVPGAVALCPTHAVVHNVLHAQVQDRGHAVAALPLRQLHTLVAVARADGPDIDWSTVGERLRGAGHSRELDAYIALATRFFAWQPPPDIAATRRTRIHTAAVVASATLRWPSDVAYNLSSALDAAYLDALYHHDGRPTQLALARGSHLVRVLRQRGRHAMQEATAPHR